MANRFKFRAWEWHERGGIMLHEWSEELSSWINRELPVMQYTGLKDKHGKEIFEGDIIQLNVGNVHLICPVVWDDDDSEFLMQHPEGYHGHYGLQKKIIECCAIFKIIGDIYRNPELVEPSHE